MAAPTLSVQDIKDFAPELANAGDARIQIWIDDCPLDLAGFGTELPKQKSAWRLWVCHKLTVTKSGRVIGAAGPVVSEQVGQVSVQYSELGQGKTKSASQNDLMSTSYGRELQVRIDACFGGVRVA
jgi:hypothetical protein